MIILKRKDFSNSESLFCSNLPTKFGSIQHIVQKKMSFDEFQDGCQAFHGGHLEYLNKIQLQ